MANLLTGLRLLLAVPAALAFAQQEFLSPLLLLTLVGIAIVLIGRKKWTYELPFGTYLGVAAIVVMLWRADMLSWYWQTVLQQTR